MGTKLTKRQTEILALIQSHMSKTGSPPTRAEIAKVMGFRSPNAAEDHLRALARKGVIELVPGTSRGIRLTEGAGIPIYAFPISKKSFLSEEPLGKTTRLPITLFGPSIHFVLKVGTSEFSSLGILNGDFLAIHQTSEVPHQQLALVRLNSEFTLRRLSKEIEQQRPTIEGQVVGILRSLGTSDLP